MTSGLVKAVAITTGSLIAAGLLASVYGKPWTTNEGSQFGVVGLLFLLNVVACVASAAYLGRIAKWARWHISVLAFLVSAPIAALVDAFVFRLGNSNIAWYDFDARVMPLLGLMFPGLAIGVLVVMFTANTKSVAD